MRIGAKKQKKKKKIAYKPKQKQIYFLKNVSEQQRPTFEGLWLGSPRTKLFFLSFRKSMCVINSATHKLMDRYIGLHELPVIQL